MSLEQKVKEVVDSWSIIIQDKCEFEQSLKNIYYGIGIALTNKAMKSLMPIDDSEKIINTTLLNTKLKYHEAVDNFKLEYITKNYIKFDFDFKKINQECQIGIDVKTAWNIMDRELKKHGLKFKDIKNIKPLTSYKSQFSNEKEVTEMIEKEIGNYEIIAGKYSLLARGLEKGKVEMSQIFVEVAKNTITAENHQMNMPEFYNLAYHKAINEFKKAYLIKQYFNAEKNGKLAAKRAGMSYKLYNGALTRIAGLGFTNLNKLI